LTITARINSAIQGAFNRHVLGERRQETRDVVRRQGVRLPGELQCGKGQAHQPQATAALHLGQRPGEEQQEPYEQQRTAERHEREFNRGPQQASCQ
jgi:hypothetical protein